MCLPYLLMMIQIHKVNLKNKKVRVVFFLMICAIILLLIFLHGRQMRENHLLTIGQIVKCDEGSGSRGNFGLNIHYQYHVNGKVLYGSRRHSYLRCDFGKFIVGKSFPVVYRKYWFGYEENIMITPKDFEYYRHSFPDSLKWISKYIDE